MCESVCVESTWSVSQGMWGQGKGEGMRVSVQSPSLADCTLTRINNNWANSAMLMSCDDHGAGHFDPHTVSMLALEV